MLRWRQCGRRDLRRSWRLQLRLHAFGRLRASQCDGWMMRTDRGIRTIDVAVLGVDADPVYAAAGDCSGVIRP